MGSHCNIRTYSIITSISTNNILRGHIFLWPVRGEEVSSTAALVRASTGPLFIRKLLDACLQVSHELLLGDCVEVLVSLGVHFEAIAIRETAPFDLPR